jgi:hypothetical protein
LSRYRSISVLLDHPVDLPVDQVVLAGVDRGERALPELEDLLDHRSFGGQVAAGDEVLGLAEVLGLDLQRADLAAVGQPDRASAGHVVADLADRADRVLQAEVPHDDAGFDHPQHEIGRAHLEQRRRFGHVGVADDHVQPPVPLGVRMRLVSGVDDGAAARGGAGDALPDVLRALAQAVDGAARGLQHLPGPADELPAHQERDQDVRKLAEVAGPRDQVVLVAAVRVPGRVGVVLEEVDIAGDALLVQAPLGVHEQAFEDPLAGLVVGHELAQVVALGSGVLGVAADVEVEARPVAQEHVAAAAPRHDAAEQVTRDLVRREPALTAEGTGDAVLGLDPEDPPVHGLSVGRDRPAGAHRGRRAAPK